MGGCDHNTKRLTGSRRAVGKTRYPRANGQVPVLVMNAMNVG